MWQAWKCHWKLTFEKVSLLFLRKKEKKKRPPFFPSGYYTIYAYMVQEVSLLNTHRECIHCQCKAGGHGSTKNIGFIRNSANLSGWETQKNCKNWKRPPKKLVHYLHIKRDFDKMEAMGLALSKNTALKYQKRDLEKMLHLSIHMNENGTND